MSFRLRILPGPCASDTVSATFMSCARLRPDVSRRRSRAVAAGLATDIALASARNVAAAPLDDPFVGGLSFSGPTSGNVAAVYWNPAALGLVRGVQFMAAGSGRLTRTT